MKLDKTLEEITTYNKSLNNPTGEVAKEYFKLRKTNDKRISNLKSVHKDKKLNLIYDIKQLKNVSIQKIDYNITLYKSSVKENNIFDISNKVYLSLINTFEYNISKYYINNKEVIINYIIEVYKMQLQIIELNKELNSTINQFIKDNNISKYRLARLVTTYKTIKNDLQFYKKYCFDIEQFKQLQSKDDEITTFIEEFFLECVHEIESKRTLNEIYKLNEQNKELDYKFRVSKEYTPKIGNNTKEFVTQSIIKETDESTHEENILENIITTNKELTTSLTELCKTPKKEVIQKKPKTKEELTEFKRKQKLYKEAMKQIGFV